jgi:sodium/bile acid cotransporter 7
MKWHIDWFLIGILCAAFLAWLFPDPGIRGSWLHPEILTTAGLVMVFFLHGLALPFEKIKAGILHWRLHLAVQATTFIFFPLCGLAALALFAPSASPEVKTGFFFLCALPSTVSSSVALTAVAHGNVAAALFNASISSIIGIFATPLWMNIIYKTQESVPVGQVIFDLVLCLLMPLIVGQLSRPLLSEWAVRHKPFINRMDRGVILLLVYTSFCGSMKMHVWNQYGISFPVIVLLSSLLLFFIAFQFTSFLSALFKFSFNDKIAIVFCGSKKSLAQGVLMAQFMFPHNPALGVILIPIMIYHSLQLFLSSMLASRWKHQHFTSQTPA